MHPVFRINVPADSYLFQWLQSKERQAELFDEVMVRYRYDFLPNLSQLVLLSVSAAVSVKFEHKVMERLSWLEGVLAVLDPEVDIATPQDTRGHHG